MSTSTAATPPAPARSTALLVTRIALGLALLALLMLLLAGPGSRWGLWHFGTGLRMMGWAAYAAIAAFVLSLVAAVLSLRARRSPLPAIAGMALALIAFLPPFLFQRTARSVPPIHDITTDTENPPPFVAVVGLREQAGATNPAAYEGDSIAAQQRKAYPDVRPVMMPTPVDSAFDAALAAANDMGWEIVDVNKAQGRIEASDRTFWFGFVDDVVIRVVPASGISRVDVRSVSRVGRSDVGANAKRIRGYLDRLREQARERGITLPAE